MPPAGTRGTTSRNGRQRRGPRRLAEHRRGLARGRDSCRCGPAGPGSRAAPRAYRDRELERGAADRRTVPDPLAVGPGQDPRDAWDGDGPRALRIIPIPETTRAPVWSPGARACPVGTLEPPGRTAEE